MSIIKDGKVYRTLEEQVYYLTKEQKEMKDTDNSLSNRINQKQDKLTEESVDSGTLDKAIGFDSEGNLVKGNVSADYNDLTNKPIINQTEQSSTSPFVDEQTIDNGAIIHFDLTKGSVIADFLENISYTSEGGMVEYLADGSDFILAAYDLSSMNMGKIIILINREGGSSKPKVIYGTTAGDVGEFDWQEGFNNLDENGDFTISLEDSETISVNPLAGWNGVFVFLKATTIIPVPENGNYYRKPDGKIYYYNNNEYKQVLAEGDLSYDATVIEDSTNAVQGGAVYDALEEKQDVIEDSDVPSNGVVNVLGTDTDGNLSKAPASDFLRTSDFPYSSDTMNTILGRDSNDDLCSGNNISPGFINPGSGNVGKFLKVVSPFDPHADWESISATDLDASGATSGYVLTADGNGGASWQNAGGGSGKYEHNIQIKSGAGDYIRLYIKIITNGANSYKNELATHLSNVLLTPISSYIQATGIYVDNNGTFNICSVLCGNTNLLISIFNERSSSLNTIQLAYNTSISSDDVIPL